LGDERKLISKSANFYAKTALGIKDVNDCTGGFRAIRASTLEQIDFRSLKTKGYAFQISLLEGMRRNNAVMGEVPIAFKDRTSGTSKMRVHDILEEGFFVLRASIANTFRPRKILRKSQGETNWLLDQNIGPSIGISQAHGTGEHRIESNQTLEYSQAYAIGEEIFNVKATSI